MDTKSSFEQIQAERQSTIANNAYHQEASMEKGRADIIVPDCSNRKILNGSIIPVVRVIEKHLDTLNPECGIQTGSIDPHYQNLTVSSPDASQHGPAFVLCHTLSEYGKRRDDWEAGITHTTTELLTSGDATGDMSAYQISSPTTSLHNGVVMASSPGPVNNTQPLCEEASRKRELRLMKNRFAAKESRRRKKEYVKCLEEQVATLKLQNKELKEMINILKGYFKGE